MIEHLEAQFPWLTDVFNGHVLESYRTAQQALTYQEHEEHVLSGRTALWISNPGILNRSGMTTANKPVRGCKRDVFPFMKKYFTTRVTKICTMSQLLKTFFNWTRTFTRERWFSSLKCVNQTSPGHKCNDTAIHFLLSLTWAPALLLLLQTTTVARTLLSAGRSSTALCALPAQ